MAIPVRNAVHCFRTRNASCDVCCDACPMGALSSGPSGPVCDESLCTGCGICAAACPASVFAPHADTRLLARRLPEPLERDTLVLACAACGEPSLPAGLRERSCTALRLTGCPGALHPAVLAACVSSGVTRLVLVRGDCTFCAVRGGSAVERTCSLWKAMARGEASVHDAASRSGKSARFLDVRTRHVSRRSLLSLCFVLSVGERRFDPLPDLADALWRGGTRPDLRGVFRSILRAASGFVRPDGLVPAMVGGFTVRVDTDACIGCGACARGCVGGALEADAFSGGVTGFTVGRCLGCGLCGEICPVRAITREPASVTFREWLCDEPEKAGPAGREMRVCARCRASFAPARSDDVYCRVCKKRLGGA